VRTEIKERAWEQIATAGASALSLNAIAKQMGMSGPALYRYYAGRDELITELITDAYRSLADALHSTASAGADLAALARPSAPGPWKTPSGTSSSTAPPSPGTTHPTTPRPSPLRSWRYCSTPALR
jgi:AcrR family transcriptional regulator